MTVKDNEYLLSLPAKEFRRIWLESDEETVRQRQIETERFEEQKDLTACICDACIKVRGIQQCELLYSCGAKMAEHLISLGVRRSDRTVTEALNDLSRRLKQNVTPQSVDNFTEAKFQMLIIENDYIKRCSPEYHKQLMKGVK